MAVPDGYTLAEIGKTYTNVDYWIKTSGSINDSPTADTDTVVWYNGETEIFKQEEYMIDSGEAKLTYVPASLKIFDERGNGWVVSETNGINANGKIVVNGVVVDKISLTHTKAWSESDDDTLDDYTHSWENDTYYSWLYVKEPAPPTPQPATHEMTITLGEGVESLEMNFTEPEQQVIRFAIGGVSYFADSGMTWAEWCDSSYNINDLYEYEDDIAGSGTGLVAQTIHMGGNYSNAVLKGENQGFVQPNDTIIENYDYPLKASGGGGSD